MDNLTQELKEKAVEYGATVVGIADATLYKGAPEGHRPEDILNGATSVLSMGFLQPAQIGHREIHANPIYPEYFHRSLSCGSGGKSDGFVAGRKSI